MRSHRPTQDTLWETYKRHYGPNGDSTILEAKGATRDFNPNLPQSLIDKAMNRDPAAAPLPRTGRVQDERERLDYA